MALWLIRSGKHGEHEQKFLADSRVYVTWEGFNVDLSTLNSVTDLRTALQSQHPNSGHKTIINWGSQLWPFLREIKPGDWVVTPAKNKNALHISEIIGPYVHNPMGPDPYFHYRAVRWIAKDVPRQAFAQDLLYSFGAFMTICAIKRNNAEARVRETLARSRDNEQPSLKIPPTETATDDQSDAPPDVDLEQLARDAIAKLIQAKFKGHGLALLVDAILRAQGYTTHLSPPGADKGVDILAAPEPFGFGHPKLCVQVKSEQNPIDRPTLDQLIGAMQNFHAEQALLVAWGGFRSSVHKELPVHFFKVRLWDQQALIDQLVNNYDRLDADLRAEIPLKRIWTIATEDVEE